MQSVQASHCYFRARSVPAIASHRIAMAICQHRTDRAVRAHHVAFIPSHSRRTECRRHRSDMFDFERPRMNWPAASSKCSAATNGRVGQMLALVRAGTSTSVASHARQSVEKMRLCRWQIANSRRITTHGSALSVSTDGSAVLHSQRKPSSDFCEFSVCRSSAPKRVRCHRTMA